MGIRIAENFQAVLLEITVDKMALGGGTYLVQNKELPGAYINFVSAASANAALSERGIATLRFLRRKGEAPLLPPVPQMP